MQHGCGYWISPHRQAAHSVKIKILGEFEHHLANQRRGHTVEGRHVSIDEWRQGVASGDIVEVFACGTAAVVAPIGVLKGADFVDEQPLGPLALSLREELTDIQYGRREDVHGWLERLDG